MIKVISTSLLMFCLSILFGQNTSIEVVYQITHENKKVNKSEMANMPDNIKSLVVKQMTNTSKVKHFYKLLSNGDTSKYVYDHSVFPEGINGQHTGLDIYKDINQEKIIIISPVLPADTKIYERFPKKSMWNIIENEYKQIAGYKCQKAMSTDGKIIAWFTEQIKIKDGPDKYCNLPGLILKINKNHGQKIIVAKKITIFDHRLKVNLPNRSKTITFKEYKNKILYK